MLYEVRAEVTILVNVENEEEARELVANLYDDNAHIERVHNVFEVEEA